jgi:hypothetical protein
MLYIQKNGQLISYIYSDKCYEYIYKPYVNKTGDYISNDIIKKIKENDYPFDEMKVYVNILQKALQFRNELFVDTNYEQPENII